MRIDLNTAVELAETLTAITDSCLEITQDLKERDQARWPQQPLY